MKDGTVIKLSPDEQAVALRRVGDLMEASSHLYAQIKAGQLDTQMRGVLLGLCEFSLADAAKVLGYESDLAAAIEERHGEIRAANRRVHELEAQLGLSRTTDGLAALIKRLYETICAWWQRDGFGHVSIDGFSFGPFGVCRVTFCCMMFGPRDHDSDTPVTARQRYAAWKASLPYDLYQTPGEHEPDLLDTPKNRELLLALLNGRFPSLQVVAWHNRHIHGAQPPLWELHEIECVIYNLADMEEPCPVTI